MRLVAHGANGVMVHPGPLHALFAEATAVAPDERELAWYRDRFPPDDGLVLDVGCGIGRLLVPLVAQGRKVHGVEASAALLERCVARLAAVAGDTATFRQPLPQMNLPFRYGGAYIADGALQALVDPEDVHDALARIRAHLVAPAPMVVDCRVPPSGHQRLAAPLVEVRTAGLADGTQIALRSESTWTPAARDDGMALAPPTAAPVPTDEAPAGWVRAECRYAHRRGAQRLAEEHESLRTAWYAPDAMLALVRAAGFREAHVGPPAGTLPADEAFAVIASA